MRTLFIIISALIIGYTSNSFVWTGQLPNNGNSIQEDPLNGPKKEYYANGKIMREYTLKDGKVDGSYKFYDELGRLVSDQMFKDGEPNGVLKTFYPSGQLKMVGNMRPNGDVTGQSKEYYENGMIKSESSISGQMPKISSNSKIYSKDGKLVQEINVSMGELVFSISYDDQGRVTSEEKPGQNISYWYERDTGKKHTSINGVPQD